MKEPKEYALGACFIWQNVYYLFTLNDNGESLRVLIEICADLVNLFNLSKIIPKTDL